MRFLTVLLSATLPFAAFAADPAPTPKMLELAKQAVNLTNPEQNMQAAASAADNPMVSQLLKTMDMASVKTKAADLMASMFTEAELDALVKFYSSAEGRTVSAKMPDYQRKMAEFLQTEMFAGMKKLQATNPELFEGAKMMEEGGKKEPAAAPADK